MKEKDSSSQFCNICGYKLEMIDWDVQRDPTTINNYLDNFYKDKIESKIHQLMPSIKQYYKKFYKRPKIAFIFGISFFNLLPHLVMTYFMPLDYFNEPFSNTFLYILVVLIGFFLFFRIEGKTSNYHSVKDEFFNKLRLRKNQPIHLISIDRGGFLAVTTLGIDFLISLLIMGFPFWIDSFLTILTIILKVKLFYYSKKASHFEVLKDYLLIKKKMGNKFILIPWSNISEVSIYKETNDNFDNYGNQTTPIYNLYFKFKLFNQKEGLFIHIFYDQQIIEILKDYFQFISDLIIKKEFKRNFPQVLLLNSELNENFNFPLIFYCPNCKNKIKPKEFICHICGYNVREHLKLKSNNQSSFSMVINSFYNKYIEENANFIKGKLEFESKKNNLPENLINGCLIFLYLVFLLFIYVLVRTSPIIIIPYALLTIIRIYYSIKILRENKRYIYRPQSLKHQILDKLNLKHEGSIALENIPNSYSYTGFSLIFLILNLLLFVPSFFLYAIIIITTLHIIELQSNPRRIKFNTKIYNEGIYIYNKDICGSKWIRWSEIKVAKIRKELKVNSGDYGTTYYYHRYISIVLARNNEIIEFNHRNRDQFIVELIVKFINYMRDSNNLDYNKVEKDQRKESNQESLDRNKVHEHTLFCAYCGTKNVGNYSFCRECGNKVEKPRVLDKKILYLKKNTRKKICHLCGNNKDNNGFYCPECGNQFELLQKMI
jgi:predicted amidophosphoribosyltransferase